VAVNGGSAMGNFLENFLFAFVGQPSFSHEHFPHVFLMRVVILHGATNPTALASDFTRGIFFGGFRCHGRFAMGICGVFPPPPWFLYGSLPTRAVGGGRARSQPNVLAQTAKKKPKGSRVLGGARTPVR
jgi:hypothetical protein